MEKISKPWPGRPLLSGGTWRSGELPDNCANERQITKYIHHHHTKLRRYDEIGPGWNSTTTKNACIVHPRPYEDIIFCTYTPRGHPRQRRNHPETVRPTTHLLRPSFSVEVSLYMGSRTCEPARVERNGPRLPSMRHPVCSLPGRAQLRPKSKQSEYAGSPQFIPRILNVRDGDQCHLSRHNYDT